MTIHLAWLCLFRTLLESSSIVPPEIMLMTLRMDSLSCASVPSCFVDGLIVMALVLRGSSGVASWGSDKVEVADEGEDQLTWFAHMRMGTR